MTLKGKQGAEQISAILTSFRNDPPKQMAGKQITQAEDYSTGKRTVFADHHEEDIDLPKSNVLKYFAKTALGSAFVHQERSRK